MAEGSERLVAALGQWRAGRGPLFERLASALVRASEQAALPAGGALPAERVLARELEVSRSTVVAAYQELRERGVAVTRHGSGTVIRNVMPAAAGASSPAVAALLARADVSTPLIDLSVGAPDFDELVRDLTVSGSALPLRARGHGYVPLGWPELRDLVAQLLSRRGLATSPDEVLITNGAQEAISLAIGLVAADGRRVAVESPGYPSALGRDCARRRPVTRHRARRRRPARRQPQRAACPPPPPRALHRHILQQPDRRPHRTAPRRADRRPSRRSRSHGD
jgi:DNA-binding transcriptional regulator YhcF (GntR family)